MSKLVTLKSFVYPTEAYPLISKLESEGIKCFLEGENTLLVDPLISNAIGGARLKVMENDVPKSLEILRLNESFFKENEKRREKMPDDFLRNFNKVETFCPECESTNIYQKRKGWLNSVFSNLFVMQKKHYCADCAYVWKQ